jgi:predicted hotdog family 3-hydroxylacyl-ACP dehydratase
MPLNRTWIAQNIPHHGRMCLLDEVIEWDAQHIRCRSTTHRLPDHPLRSHDRLGVCCGIEYATQAMAVHGALRRRGERPPPRAGFSPPRDVRLHVLRLDDIQTDLICEAALVAGDPGSALYEFELRSERAAPGNRARDGGVRRHNLSEHSAWPQP